MSSCSKCGGPATNLDNQNCSYCGAVIKNDKGEFIEETVFNSYLEFLENFKEKIKKLESKIGEVDLNFDDDIFEDDPNRKIASASSLTSSNQATNFFSRGKLVSDVGAPKCWSEAK